MWHRHPHHHQTFRCPSTHHFLVLAGALKDLLERNRRRVTPMRLSFQEERFPLGHRVPNSRLDHRVYRSPEVRSLHSLQLDPKLDSFLLGHRVVSYHKVYRDPYRKDLRVDPYRKDLRADPFLQDLKVDPSQERH